MILRTFVEKCRKFMHFCFKNVGQIRPRKMCCWQLETPSDSWTHNCLTYVKLYTPSDSWTHNCPTFRQLNTPLDSWTQNSLTYGQLDTKLFDHWTITDLTVRPLYSWTQHWLTIGQLDTYLSDHWTVGDSNANVQPLDSLNNHCPTLFGQLYQFGHFSYKF